MIIYSDLFEKLDQYRESLPFDFYKFSEHPEVLTVVEDVFAEFVFDKNAKKTSIYRTKEYLKMLICNFFVGYVSGKCIAIPRAKNFYSDKQNFKFDVISQTVFLDVLDHLKATGYIGEKLGCKFADDEKGFTSRYWAMPQLFNKFENFSWEMIERKVGGVVILRDTEKQECNFRENVFTRELKKKITGINEQYETHYFNTVLDNQDSTGRQTRLFPRLASVFNRKSFDFGGRLYSISKRGIGFQSLSKEERKRIKINGESCIELDYSGLHIHLLYAGKGIQFDQEPYSFVSDELRPVVKTFLLVLINAKNQKAAIMAMEKIHRELLHKKQLTKRDASLLASIENNHVDWQDLLNQIKTFHSGISEFFGSDMGVVLQKIDSQMAVEIVNHFSKKNIPVLPIHDSFIIQARFADELKEKMQSVYRQFNNGFSCPIK